MTDIDDGFDTLGGHAAIAALGANDDFVQISENDLFKHATISAFFRQRKIG